MRELEKGEKMRKKERKKERIPKKDVIMNDLGTR